MDPFGHEVPGKWIDRAGQRRALDKLILDPNSLVSETYGRRELICDSVAGPPCQPSGVAEGDS